MFVGVLSQEFVGLQEPTPTPSSSTLHLQTGTNPKFKRIFYSKYILIAELEYFQPLDLEMQYEMPFNSNIHGSHYYLLVLPPSLLFREQIRPPFAMYEKPCHISQTFFYNFY